MRAMQSAVVAVAFVVLTAGFGAAQEGPIEYRSPDPRSAATAAACNVVFMPVRLAVTTVGGVLGGLTGFLTAGDKNAADDIWGLFDGQVYLTPQIIQGKEALRFGNLQSSVRVTE